MTKSIKKSLLTILIAAFLASIAALSISFSFARATEYQGLTGTKQQSEVTAAVTLSSFVLEDGASIRVEAPYGIRFITKISQDDLDKLPDNAQFGTVILPKSMLGDAELTVDTASSKTAYAQNYSLEDGVYSFTSVLVGKKNSETNEFVDLAKQFYGMEFCARSFVTYTYTGADGDVTETIYTQTVSKIPREVANSTLATDNGESPENVIANLKAFAEEDDKIAYFDSPLGAAQVTAHSVAKEKVAFEYSTEKSFGDEKGSLKLTFTDPDGEEGEKIAAPGGAGQTFTFTDYLIKQDLTGYEYIMFSVWASHTAQFSIYSGVGSTNLVANTWNNFVIEVKTLTEKGLDITNFGSFIFCVYKYPNVSEGPIDGSTYYISSIRAINKSDQVQDKIGHFDEEFGICQASVASTNKDRMVLSYTTTKSYGDEAGSLKIVYSKSQAGNGQTFTYSNLINKSVSDYDYVEFHIWTDTASTKFKFFSPNTGETILTANQWTAIRVNVTDIAGLSNLTNGTADITGMQFCFYGIPSTGATFYVSAMYGRKNITQQTGKIAYFDTSYGVTQVTEHSVNAERIETAYSTKVKYGEEAGSLKITYSLAPGGAGQALTLGNLLESDVSNYDYIEFYVWTDTPSWFAFYNGVGKTNLQSNQWNHVKISVADIANASYLTNGTSDITGLLLCFFAGPTAGSEYYISAIYAGTNAE